MENLNLEKTHHILTSQASKKVLVSAEPSPFLIWTNTIHIYCNADVIYLLMSTWQPLIDILFTRNYQDASPVYMMSYTDESLLGYIGYLTENEAILKSVVKYKMIQKTPCFS